MNHNECVLSCSDPSLCNWEGIPVRIISDAHAIFYEHIPPTIIRPYVLFRTGGDDFNATMTAIWMRLFDPNSSSENYNKMIYEMVNSTPLKIQAIANLKNLETVEVNSNCLMYKATPIGLRILVEDGCLSKKTQRDENDEQAYMLIADIPDSHFKGLGFWADSKIAAQRFIDQHGG